MNRQASQLDDFVRDLNLDPAVEYAEKIPLAYAQFEPADPDFGQQWPLRNTGQSGGTNDADIDASEAWDVDDGSSTTIVVAVIDTGIDYGHPDLDGNIWTNPGEDAWTDPMDPSTGNGVDDDGNGLVDDWKGWDFVGANPLFPRQDNDPKDVLGHGTHVSGIVAAVSNDEGGVGVNFHAKILPLKIGGDSELMNSVKAVQAIDYVIDLKTRSMSGEPNLRVINASWSMAAPLQAMKTAIEAAGDAGILFVAAAANGGSDGVGDNIDNPPFLQGSWPAAFDSKTIVGVAATDHDDDLAGFSNYGPQNVDLGAPGVDYFSTLPTYESVMSTDYGFSQGYDFASGTSMAAPCVAGAAALLFSADPSLTPCEVKSLLMENGDPSPALEGKTVTGGRLNLANAISETPVDTDDDGTPDVCDDDDDNDGCEDSIDSDPFLWSEDADLDDFGSDCDCEDDNPAVNPGVEEITGNGIDDDCNPATRDQVGCGGTATAQAAVYGDRSSTSSVGINLLTGFLIPLGTVLVLKRLRRKK
jgi:subtilisin family serine protease